VEEWDIPGAYPRANTDPNFRVILRQPKLSNGSLTHPGQQYLIAKAEQGAPDACFRWESNRNCKLTRLGWKNIKSEPGAFYRSAGPN
jgi:hypothetical protein